MAADSLARSDDAAAVTEYLGFLGRCQLESREYSALKTAIVEREAEAIVKILCDLSDAELLLQHAKKFYAAAVPYLQDNLKTGELRIVATEYRREPRSQTWHLCSNCSHWPDGVDFLISNHLSSDYQICNECIVLNQQGRCK